MMPLIMVPELNKNKVEISSLRQLLVEHHRGLWSTEDREKIQFITEISSLRQQMHSSWVVLGDFNLIYRACDKNNDRVNRGMMRRFKSALDILELKEI